MCFDDAVVVVGTLNLSRNMPCASICPVPSALPPWRWCAPLRAQVSFDSRLSARDSPVTRSSVWPSLVGWIQYMPSLTGGFTRAPSHGCTPKVQRCGSSGACRPRLGHVYHTHARMHARHVPKREPPGTSAAGISAYQETEKSSKFRPRMPLREAWPFRQQHLKRHAPRLALSRCALPRRVQGLPFAPVDLLEHHALHLCAAKGFEAQGRAWAQHHIVCGHDGR